MGGFHGLNMKKIGSKNHKKSASFSVSATFFLSPPWPMAATTLITGLSTTISTIKSHLTTSCGGSTTFLSSLPTNFFFFCFSLSLPFVPIQPPPFLSSASCCPPMLAEHRRHARCSSLLSLLLLPFLLHAVPQS